MSKAAKTLRETFGLAVSDAGARCAELVETWVGGLHHFPEGQKALRKTDWSGEYVTFLVYGSIATFDHDQITRPCSSRTTTRSASRSSPRCGTSASCSTRGREKAT